MPFPAWTQPKNDPQKPWTRPVPGDERRAPPPTEDAWWDAIGNGDASQVSAWLDGPSRYVYDDPRSALLGAKNAEGYTALGWLVSRPELAEATVRLLPALLSGSSTPLSPGHKPHTSRSPLWEALEHPVEAVARTMWEHLGPDRVMEPSWLHMAVEEGCEAIVIRRLLAWGVPVDDRTAGTGETALYAAVRTWQITRHHQGVIEALINAGADPQARDHNGQTVLGRAQAMVRNDRQPTLVPIIDLLGVRAEQAALRQALNERKGSPDLQPGLPRRRL